MTPDQMKQSEALVKEATHADCVKYYTVPWFSGPAFDIVKVGYEDEDGDDDYQFVSLEKGHLIRYPEYEDLILRLFSETTKTLHLEQEQTRSFMVTEVTASVIALGLMGALIYNLVQQKGSNDAWKVAAGIFAALSAYYFGARTSKKTKNT